MLKKSIFFVAILCILVLVTCVYIFFNNKYINNLIFNSGYKIFQKKDARVSISDNNELSLSQDTLQYKLTFKTSNRDSRLKNHKFNVVIAYDYVILDSIEDDELNKLLNTYLENFQKIFNSESYEFYNKEDSIVELMSRCRDFVSSNSDERVSFSFALESFSTINPNDVFSTIDPYKLDALKTVDYESLHPRTQ